ncbi:hypothetical protein F4819DRAFT_506129 [Hypoxylon fuscum]|nr:hypothetical protein F4819DRAFT_506129 [Hypoxylon fuscum]
MENTKQRKDIPITDNKEVTIDKKKDIIGYLPQELVFNIIDNLDFTDLLNCHLVSDQWRYIFFDERVSALISRKYFKDSTAKGAQLMKICIMQGVASKLHGQPMPPTRTITSGLLLGGGLGGLTR